MDKQKSSDFHAQTSWMEMHQFIGDLITSGHASKDHPDVANAVWGVVGGEASLEPLQPPRPVQDKAEAGRLVQPGAAQRKRKASDGREDVHHACTCPGCPYSSSPSFETLKSRKACSSRADAACLPKKLSSSAPMNVPDSTAEARGSTTSVLENSSASRPQREDTDDATQSPNQSSETLPSRASSLNHLSMLPCLCCHRGLRPCSQILNPQEGTDSPFPHTHHHFHHHHCPISSCLPCPQLGQTHAPQLSAQFPCLSCQHSIPTCTQVCHHQHRQIRTALQEERGRATLLSLHHCMHCSASFSRPSQLLQHQRSEHAHKPSGFLCTQCGRAFNSHSNLRIHLNVHSGARPYTCSECGKSFSQSGALKIHRRIHTGERPYSCGFCGRGFPHLAGVRAHQRTHTGEKPYRCSQCGKCFTQSGALKIHTRIHTGERPFVCSLCGKGFSNRSGIQFHYRTVHGLAPEHAREDGAGGAYRGAAGHGVSPGRPRTIPPASVRPITNSPNSNTHATLDPRDSGAPSGFTLLSGNMSKSQAEATNPGRNREGLSYACEDCGLCFKDAPSRNRHQTLVHYSSEGRGEEEAQRKQLSTNERVGEKSGE